MRSQQELLEIFINEVQNQDDQLTDDLEGSLLDVVGGAVSTAVSESQQIAIDQFKKTFIDTANGPAITGGPDDLQTLAVDHYGDGFARPGAVKASGVVTFTRPNTSAGDVTIVAGTVVKTPANANGTSQSFETLIDVLMTGTSVNASVKAKTAGTAGNVDPNTVTQIETTLTDTSISVNNSAQFSGGEEEQDDVKYRETIRTLLQSLKGGTLAAIEAKAKTVPGIAFAKALEFLQYVKEWDIGLDLPVGDYFALPRARVYVADANGNASPTLVASAQDAVDVVRADGVRVEVIAAVALSQNWTASISLNPSGPNFSVLQTDTQLIKDTMKKYLQDLAIGSSFVRSTAKAFIMSVYGPSGTNDLTNFTILTPSGDVTATQNQKIVPGTIGIS